MILASEMIFVQKSMKVVYLSIKDFKEILKYGIQKRNFVHNDSTIKEFYKIDPLTLSFKKKIAQF